MQKASSVGFLQSCVGSVGVVAAQGVDAATLLPYPSMCVTSSACSLNVSREWWLHCLWRPLALLCLVVS